MRNDFEIVGEAGRSDQGNGGNEGEVELGSRDGGGGVCLTFRICLAGVCVFGQGVWQERMRPGVRRRYNVKIDRIAMC